MIARRGFLSAILIAAMGAFKKMGIPERVIRWRPTRTVTVNPNTVPRLYEVNRPNEGPQSTPPGVGGPGNAPYDPKFVGDGFVYPRPNDQRFDVTARAPVIAVSSTVEAVIWDVDANIKGGWIRALGYGFNNAHGDFVVRTFLLINDQVPSDYLFRTVDTTAGTFEGSFPTVNIGSLQQPTEVHIRIPAQSKISIRFVNNSADEVFSGAVRLKGWFFST